MSDGSYSMSDIQDHIKYIITKPETLTTVPSIHVYITIINNRLVFEKRDGYNLELQTPETMKFIWQQKQLQKKNWRKCFEVVEVVLVQCNLLDNKYQQKSELLYTFTPNKSYVYLLNVEPSNLVPLEIYNTEFDEIIITFTDQNRRPFEVEDKVNLTLLSNK